MLKDLGKKYSSARMILELNAIKSNEWKNATGSYKTQNKEIENEKERTSP